MAGAGTRVHNPHSGETITFLETATDNGGERFRMEIRVEAGRSGMAGPDHYHPVQEERFELLAGRARFRLDGREWDAEAGETVVVPPRSAHIFGNGGPDELVMISTYTPAPPRIETFFETIFGLAEEGRFYRASGSPRLLQAVRVMNHCRGYMILTSPPPALQRIAFPPLALLGRLTGAELREADVPS
jgi:mannose-6-phosphate isomerase-like protein (cupin superfamily)